MEIGDDDIVQNVTVKDGFTKNPLLMTLTFYNTKISQKLRVLVESSVRDILKEYYESDYRLQENMKIYEQNSSIKLNSSENKDDEELPIVVSCSHIYEDLVIDRVGIPLCHNNPLKTCWYAAPHYNQLYLSCPINNTVSSGINSNHSNDLDLINNCDSEYLKIKPLFSKSCFNCGSIEHELSKCPLPKDFSRISSKKKEFINSFNHSTSIFSDFKRRYHEDSQIKNPFHGCEPGKISDELRLALNLKKNELPLFIYRMRIFGYPPGYSQNYCVNPNINVIDHPNDNHIVSELSTESLNNDSMDSSSLKKIMYPGFNAPLPDGVLDNGPSMGFPKLRLERSSLKKTKKIKSKSEMNNTVQPGDNHFCIDNEIAPEIVFVENNYEKVSTNDAIEIQRSRGWYSDPLCVNMFIPKPTWRRPPMLEIYDSYKDPQILLEDLSKNKLIPCDSSCLVFGDQSIPTERLKNIQAILQKFNKNQHKKSKGRKTKNKKQPKK